MEGQTPPPSPTNQNVPPPGAVNTPSAAQDTAHDQEAKPDQNVPQQGTRRPADGKFESNKPKTPEPATAYHEAKVNGRVKKVTTEELLRHYQLQESAAEKFETASQKERKAQQLIDNAKKNPIQALMDPELGLTKEQIKEAMEAWYTQEYIEPETLTADQRKIRELERKVAESDAEKARAKESREANERKEHDRVYLEQSQKAIIDAMEAHRLPKTAANAKKIAFYMLQNMTKGYEAPIDLIIEQVRNERRSEDAEIEKYTYDDWLDRFGEERVKWLISENLKRLRDSRAQKGQSFTQSPIEERRESKEVSSSDVKRRLQAMIRGE